MATKFAMLLCLGLVAVASSYDVGTPRDADGSCDAEVRAGSTTQVPNLLQQRIARSSLKGLEHQEHARQEKVVETLQCIDRVFAPSMKALGWTDADAEKTIQDALAEAMVTLLIKHDDMEANPPTIDEASLSLWSSFEQYFCAVSGTHDCTIDGMTYSQARSLVLAQSKSIQSQPSLIEQPAAQAEEKEHVTIPGPRCQHTSMDTALNVETHHGLEEGSLADLAEHLRVLRERGIEAPQILHLMAMHAVKEASALGLLQEQNPIGTVAKAMALVVFSHDKMLRALGEPAHKEKMESLLASTGILLGTGPCRNISFGASSGLVAQITQTWAPFYMQLHCAVNSDCHTTYTRVLIGAINHGGSLLQKAVGAVKEGGRLVVQGLVAASMRVMSVQRYGSEVFDARADAASSLGVMAHGKDSEHLAAARTAAMELFHKKQVGGVRHLIRVMADLLRCPNV